MGSSHSATVPGSAKTAVAAQPAARKPAQTRSGRGLGSDPAVSIPTGRAMWAMMAMMLGSNLLASFNQSLMNIALDQVATDFHVSLSMANWMVLGFTIVAATVITMAAALLKRYGLRKIMLFGYVASLAGSLLGFLSWDFGAMFAARLIQALTVGLFFPVVTSVILTIAPKGKGATMLAINSGAIGVGLAFAPLLAGLLLTYVGLHALFLIPAVMSAVLLVCGLKFLHNVYERQDQRIDVVSVLLSFAGLGAFIFGLNEITRTLVPSLAFMAVGVAIVALFAWRQFHIADPLLNLSPLTHKKFAAGELLMMLGYAGSIYMSLLVPLYLEGTAGFSAFVAGALLAGPILCYALSCFVGGRIEDKRGIWPLVPAGFLVILVGFVAMEFTSSQQLVVAMMLCVATSYAGVGLVFPTLKAADLDVLPRKLFAHGSSIHSTLVQIAGSLGSALFVGIMSADVDRLMASGATKAAAYASGFSHTLLISIGILTAALIGATVYARVRSRREGQH